MESDWDTGDGMQPQGQQRLRDERIAAWRKSTESSVVTPEPTSRITVLDVMSTQCTVARES